MVKVTNIKIDEFNLISEINNKNNKNMDLCLKYLSNIDDYESKEEIEDIFPKNSKFTVSFELHDCTVELANGIRRCIMNEIPVFSLDFDEFKDYESTDSFILNDFIKNQIEYLPISQDLGDDYKKIKLSLYKKNNTDDIINVYSTDIHSNSSHKINDIITSRIILCKLRPDTHINITNINIVKGTGITNAGKFSLCSNISYKILDIKPLEYEKDYKKGISSLITTPTKFYISYSTHRNIKTPEKIIINCCDVLMERLKKISNDMENIELKDEQYFSDIIELETLNNVKILTFKNEYWTITNLLSKYSFLETNGDIEFVSPSIIHPNKYIGVLKIVHSDYLKIIKNSIKVILKELGDIKKKF